MWDMSCDRATQPTRQGREQSSPTGVDGWVGGCVRGWGGDCSDVCTAGGAATTQHLVSAPLKHALRKPVFIRRDLTRRSGVDLNTSAPKEFC